MDEAFPIKFCNGIRSYWRRRKYQKLRGSSTGSKRVVRLGGGQQISLRRRRFWKLRPGVKVRYWLLSPARLLQRLRDAYVNAMLGLSAKSSSLSMSSKEESLVAKRIPKAKSRKERSEPGDFEQRLILEIYKSVMASKNNWGAY